MKKTLVLIFLTLSIDALALGAGQTRVKTRELQKKRTEHIIEANDEYEFKACEKFNKDDEKDYYLTCTKGEITQESSLNKLSNDTSAISAKLLKKNFLLAIKEYALAALNEQHKQNEKVIRCLKDIKSDISCIPLHEKLLKGTKDGLVQIRKLMALSSSPLHSYGPTKIYTNTLSHKIGKTRVPTLSKIEVEELDYYQNTFIKAHEQNWMAKNFEKNKCIEKDILNNYTFKKSGGPYSCEGYFANTVKADREKELKNIRNEINNEYMKMATQMPLLTSLPLRGDEKDDVITKHLLETLNKTKKDIEQTQKNIHSYTDAELYQLVAGTQMVESFLQEHGPPEYLCDMAQEFKDKLFYDELKTDLTLAAGAIVGGGVCALTAGFGCVAGVAIIGEGASIYVSNKRLADDTQLYNAGLKSASEIKERTDDFTLTLLMAPLAVGGEFLGKAVTTSRKASREILKETPITNTSIENPLYRQQMSLIRENNFKRVKVDSGNDLKFQYGKYELTTETLNANWIDNALNEKGGLYFDVENSALKRLNDSLADKDLVTSLTNLHKDILHNEMKEVLAKYPNIEIDIYSDFKSLRYSFLPKDMDERTKKALIEDLNRVYKNANQKYANMVKSLNVIPLTENPALWFQSGLGKTADEAGAASKEARRLHRDNKSITTFTEIEGNIKQKLQGIDSIQEQIQTNTKLIEKGFVETIPGTKKVTLSSDLIDEMRRLPTTADTDDYQQFGRDLTKRYDLKLSTTEIENLHNYVKELNDLTPGLWIKKREFANLDNAQAGGLTADVTGMGAENIKQVAYDLAKLEANASAADAVKKIRLGEQEITSTFNSIKKDFDLTIRDVLQRKGIPHDIVCSGDDCAVSVKEGLTMIDQEEITRVFAAKKNPSQFRLSFIPPSVAKDDRIQLATHGELIEKGLRKKIKGLSADSVDPNIVKQLTMATVMPSKLGDGPVQVIIAADKKLKLTKEQKENIEKICREIVNDMNKNLPEAKDKPLNYNMEGVRFL